ncbi:MAG: ABC transporter permease [Panacagrimonas sp.]
MIGLIARRELLDTWREGQVRLTCAILLGLLLLALGVGIQHWHRGETARVAAQTEDLRIWRSQGLLNPHHAAHFGRYIFKPVGPLAFVDEGVNPYAGSAVYLEAHKQTPSRARPADDAALLPVFGELTAALVLQLLVPLLIILVAFAGFSGERESGTFRQVLSVGVPRRRLVIGKALGLTAALAIILLPLTLIGATAILLAGLDHGDTGIDLLRLVLLSLSYLLYFTAFAGITLAVSARASSSRASLVLLLGFWLLASLLLPRLAVDAADHFAPVPTVSAFAKAVAEDIKNGVSGHDPEDARLDAVKQELFKKYGVSRVEDLPINFDGIDLAEGERYGNIVMDRHFGALWRQYGRQAEVQRAFALLSPIVALRPLSMALAGTDLTVHRSFTEQAEQYRRLTIQQINDYYTAHGQYNVWTETSGGPELWAQAPPFEYSPPPLSASLAPQAADLALLFAWSLGALLLAGWAIRRASVEAG